MRTAIAAVLGPSLLVAVAAGARAQTPPAPEATGVSVSRFSIDLYRQLQAGQGNLFFSPYSLFVALAMVREGARGDTAAELDRALSFPRDLAAAQRTLTDALHPRELSEGEPGHERRVAAYDLDVANALWGQQTLAFLPAFTGTLERRYGAPLERIDFRETEDARRRINAWVGERTHGRIQAIVPEGLPRPETRLALVNAVYFKAGWAERFGSTSEAPFHAPSGDVRARLMRRVDRLDYAEDAAVQVLSLPYRGGDASMLVILPRDPDGLAAVEQSLSADRLTRWLGALHPVRVDARIPRFELTEAFDAVQALEGLGISLAFGPRADFSGMVADEPLSIGAVLHQAFVHVDEEGTEAAAATAATMVATSAAPPREPPVSFVADHPFLLLIRHERTGCVLFMGRLSDPTRS
jgi:serpin B